MQRFISESKRMPYEESHKELRIFEPGMSTLAYELKHSKCRAKNRFSLIELLIVIAILAILASMLLPALSQAKKKARTILCLSNMRTNAFSVLSYADENGDYVVPAWAPVYAQNLTSWHIMIDMGYLKAVDASTADGTFIPYAAYKSRYSNTSLLCPEGINITDQYIGSEPDGSKNNPFDPKNSRPMYMWCSFNKTRYFCSYSPNYTEWDACWSKLPFRGSKTSNAPGFSTALCRLSAVPSPAKFVMHFEGADWLRALQWASANHSRNINLSFFDGHVESVLALRNNLPFFAEDVVANSATLKNSNFLWRIDQ